MFGTRWAELKLKLTEQELRLDALQKSFRSLEQEWNATLSRYDAILKRCNRLLKLDKDAESVPNPGEQVVRQPVELTPEMIESIWRKNNGGL